jgi:hypothetical protein
MGDFGYSRRQAGCEQFAFRQSLKRAEGFADSREGFPD